MATLLPLSLKLFRWSQWASFKLVVLHYAILVKKYLCQIYCFVYLITDNPGKVNQPNFAHGNTRMIQLDG